MAHRLASSAALATVIAIAGAPIRGARADEVEAQPIKASLDVKGDSVSASFDVTPVLTHTAAFRRHIDGGTRSRVIIEMILLDPDDKQIGYAARACQLRLDVWDEKLFVQIRDGDQDRNLKPFEDVNRGLRACGEVSGLELADLSALSRSTGYRLHVLVSLNPVSQELLERARDFLANPRGGRQARPRTIFGAVTRLFSSGQAAGGETFPFESGSLDRPTRGPH